MTYQDIVRRSVLQQRTHLLSVLSAATSASQRTALRNLVESIDAALSKGPVLRPNEVSFSHEDVAALPSREADALFDTHALGVGSPKAPLIVMGTEHAYELERPGDRMNLALEGCALGILWLAEGSSAIADRIYRSPIWARSESFVEHPNDFYRVHLDPKRKGAHTWVKLCRLLSRIWNQTPSQSFLAPRAPGLHRLGDLAYQIELSSVPARALRNGRVASAPRIAFLCEVLDTLRSARVLLFSGGDPGNAAAREAIARHFLGWPASAPVLENVVDVTHLVPRQPARVSKPSRPVRQVFSWSASRDRIALRISPALGGSVADVLLQTVADRVRPFI